MRAPEFVTGFYLKVGISRVESLAEFEMPGSNRSRVRIPRRGDVGTSVRMKTVAFYFYKDIHHNANGFPI